jgi:hypothetical protein
MDTITTIGGDEIPATYLSSVLTSSTDGAIHWLYGYRGHDLTARFDLVREGNNIRTVAHNVDWSEAYRLLFEVGAVPTVVTAEATLRAVLPPVAYDPTVRWEDARSSEAAM